MELKDLRKQTPDALRRELAQALARLQELHFQLASNQVKHVREVREIRRNVARIRMVLGDAGRNAS